MILTNAKEKQTVIIQLSDGLVSSHTDILPFQNGVQCKNASKLLEPPSEFQWGSYNNIIFGVAVGVVVVVEIKVNVLGRVLINTNSENS